jgi:NADH-quinone oxidoreductase subunit L
MEPNFGYVWLVILFPALGVIVNGFFARWIGKRGVSWLGPGVIGAAFVVACKTLVDLLALPAHERLVQEVLYTWIGSGRFVVEMALQIDPLSVIMILVVSGVGFLIHVYSVGYMHDDPGFCRYFTYLNLFSTSMLVLVLANNFLLMFVGWEGVGLCSYLLIGFWFEKKSASDAGFKAFVVNRIGDFGFAIGLLFIFVTFGSLTYTKVFHEAPHLLQAGGVTATLITLLLFVGATGKSAQIPLYVWLPDAMEGPTPVSALIHAATMVTAGVYMVARCSALYMLAPFSMTVVATIGVATALFAATIGLVQNDIKRVLAYSTVSQLGYMFTACGVGAFAAGIFHLMTHAFFKALLFLGSGSVIHGLSGEQDIRKMGALRPHMPVTYATFLVASLAIAGVFPFAGFFSKDEILFSSFAGGNYMVWAVAVFTAFLTAFYMFRLLFLTFHGSSRVDREVAKHLHESPRVMTVPLATLAVLSAVGGLVGVPIIHGANKIGEFLEPVFAHGAGHEAHIGLGAEIGLMGFSLALALAGIALAYRWYLLDPSVPGRLAERYRTLYRMLLNKYFVDEIYDDVFIQPTVAGSQKVYEGFDLKIIDGAVNGVGKFVRSVAAAARVVQTGYVRNYALTILAGVVLVVGYYLWI